MSETIAALTNGAKADNAPTKKEEEEDVINHPPPTEGGGGGGEDHCDESSEDKSLLSHVVPPSHILADGRFIQLPPPLALERSAFFERAVAVHGLISGDGEGNKKKKEKEKSTTKTKPTKRKKDGTSDNDTTTTTTTSPSPEDGTEKKKKKKSSDAPPFVHPLAIASARLHAKGIDEMSKAINLGGLVVGGEYFSLTNIVNQKLTTTATTTTSSSSSSQDATAADASSAGGVDHNGNKGMIKSNDANKEGGGAVLAVLDESILLDSRLRSKYVLQRKQSQYTNASTVLSRHGRRLSSSISVMRILDNRLRTLRQRWRLVAPEHGTRTVGPVRPREVVAVDVEIYDRDRLGGGRSSNSRTCASSNGSGSSSLGRIARRVPRFATMELEDDYDVSVDVYRLRDEMKLGLEGLKKKKSEEGEENGVNNGNNSNSAASENNKMEVVDGDNNKKESSNANNVPPCKTKAEPFAIADPTLGKIDPDFDPDKVPLLTLLFEIEKPSTGFVERATLSSSFLSSSSSATNNIGGADDKERHNMMHPDERVIEALQHSLFCASLFESMRAEIIPATSSSQSNTGGGGSASSSASQQRQKSVAWLSSEMEESFLPPPSVMAGEDTSRVGDTRLLSVIHCHEGEVKVQLDDEYSLTVKLIEAGTASAAATNNASSNVEEATTTATAKQSNGDGSRGDDEGGSSGSQSPIQLRTLCRALLLHSQSLYHDHCVKTRMDSTKAKEEEEKPHVGFARTKKEVKTPSPHILQSCVGLGCKFIFEKKVRMALKRLSHWLAATSTNCNDKISIEWLPLALFDSYSRFVLMFRDMSFDVGINGDVLRVSQTSSDHGEFRAVSFGSESELEYFLKHEIKRSLLAND